MCQDPIDRFTWQDSGKIKLQVTEEGELHWVRNMMGKNDIAKFISMRLEDLIKTLLPEYKKLLANHHDTGTDSHMHWLVASELLSRVD